MTTKADEFVLFALVLAEAMPKNERDPMSVLTLAREFSRRACRLQSLAVRACNEGLSPDYEKMQEKLGRIVQEMASAYGWEARVNGDPRGYVVKLVLPTGRYNTWGGKKEGWGVPT